MPRVETGIHLIGGMPSSGSTFLTHRLGRLPRTLVLPETGFFAHGHLLAPNHAPTPPSLYHSVPWLDTAAKSCSAVGWPTSVWTDLVEKGASPFEEVRNRIDPEGQFDLIEKTPENVFAFKAFLGADPAHRAVVTLRDAMSVVHSLWRRGFNLAEAFLIWAVHGLAIFELIKEFPDRVYLCHYDLLTRAPDRIVDEVSRFWRMTEQSADDRDERMHRMLIHSSWQLEDTAWRHSPAGEPVRTEPVNVLGLRYTSLFEGLAIEVDGRAIRIKEIEDGLSVQDTELCGVCSSSARHIDASLKSGFTQCLAQHHPLLWCGSPEVAHASQEAA